MNEEWLDAPNSEGYWWHYGNLWAANTPTPVLALRRAIQLSAGHYDPENTSGFMPAVLTYYFLVDGQHCEGKYSVYWGKWQKAKITEPTDLPEVKRG